MAEGLVRHFSRDKGFGFIVAGENNDIYFSLKSVRSGSGQLRIGSKVSFELVETTDGRLRAENVSVFSSHTTTPRVRVRKSIPHYAGQTLGLSEAQRSDALRELSRWKLEAKLEDIKRYFYTVPELDEIITGESSFVIGRKGTGKTALVEYLFERSGEGLLATKLTFKNFPFNELYSQANESYTRPNQYITVWKLIIYSAVCRLIADSPTCDPVIAKSINKAFPKPESDNLGTIVEKWIAKDFGINILGNGFNLANFGKQKQIVTLKDKGNYILDKAAHETA